MALKKYRTYCSSLLLIIIACQSIYSASGTTDKLWGLKHKGTIKTIEAKESDGGDVIDCVDIYKQPAFNNPLIKDLKMRPSSYPVGMEVESTSNLKLLQSWHKYGECPDGTIPIRRSTSSNNHTKPPPFARFHRDSNHSIKSSLLNGNEYATVSDQGSDYYGARATINVWNPKVEYGEFSTGQIWLISTITINDTYEGYNSIEAGWTVHPTRYKDNRTRFFIYWTADGNKKSGCFDLTCNGFVQINKVHSIGAALSPTSFYDGKQYEITVTIFKDSVTGDWWLQLFGIDIGYWPNPLFTTLAKRATVVNWGGQIVNDRSGGHHTTTQMGSGHFPSKEYKKSFEKSAYIRNLKVVDSDDSLRNPGYLSSSQTNEGCYDTKIHAFHKENGHSISFGGPGFSSTCF